MFASRITKTIITPSDPPYEVTIRRLSGRKLEKAQLGVMIAGADLLRQLGGGQILKEISALGGEDAVRRAAADQAERDPAQRYDKTEVLKAGIVSWRVPGAPDAEAHVPTESEIEDLEDETRDVAFLAILVLSRVHVDAPTAAELETAAKNA